MRNSATKFSILTAILAAGVMAFAAPAAMADTDVAADCSLQGRADVDHEGSETGGIPPATTAETGNTDGLGEYQFSEFVASCVAVDPATGEAAVGTLDISSSGTYDNERCGTGTAQDTDASIAATILSGAIDDLPSTLSYSIAFEAGQGLLDILGGSPGVVDGSGFIEITAEPAGTGCVTAAATGFQVAGHAVITVNDPTS